MQTIIDYFSQIPPAHRSMFLIGGIVFFWIVEGIIPLANLSYNKWKHGGLNLFFTFTTIVINFFFAGIIIKASDWAMDTHFGILNLLELPSCLYLITGLLVLDLVGAYFIHWMEHRVKWMWRFHLVHHSDTYIDTTSANRHHPGESVFRAIFTTIGVVIMGAPMWLVMLYQTLSALLSQFNHADISLPKWLDKGMSWVIVSPDMHKVHHHYMLPLTDTNFGNIFSVWDRLFGTFAYVDDVKILVYGIDTHMKPEENNEMGSLLKIPFGTYRPPTDAKFSANE
jgi:sterol desaturase/sphingolipid hydroxylase (fatty acid hydroxylase superfamily)